MNRACQLDCLLASLEANYLDYDPQKISVIFKQTDSLFKAGYERCQNLHKGVNFIQEISFKNDVIKAIDTNNQYTTFFVDDIVITNKFSLLNSDYEEFEYVKETDQDLLCHSLRLSPKIIHCYATGQKDTFVKQPTLKGKLLKWNWKGQQGDWGYPMSVDGHIFKTQFIKKICEKLNYKNPNTFEAAMTEVANFGLVPFSIMSCSNSSSKLLNIPANIVQDSYKNKHANIATVETLNNEFLNGKRLSFQHLLDCKNISVHVELPLKW